MRRTPPLIVGGGPAGAAAAIALAQQGVRATLLERSAVDGDALCGGFLSWRTLASLRRLRVDGLPGRRVDRLRLFAGDVAAERSLPAPAMGLSRRTLDAALRDAAARAGSAIERGVGAQGWEDGVLRLADGATLRPETLFLATGKHELRGLARPRDAAGEDPALGLRVRLGPHPALERLVGDGIELHLFDGGYAGLVLHEDGSANLCLAVAKSRLDEAGGPDALLAAIGALPHLGDRLAHRAPGPADAVAHIPYGWRARDTAAGIWRLGDQAAVIPSLAGEGMGIAVASGLNAAGTWLRGEAAERYQAATARAARRPLAVAGLVRDAAQAPALAPWLVRAARIPGAAALVARATRIAAPH